MPSFVALLQGINVGPHRQMAMRDLVAVCDDLGYDDVQTYLRSGNVVFRASRGSAGRIAGALEAAIAERFGFDVTTLIRTPGELERIVAGNPFVERGAQIDRLHVTFLQEKPTKAAVEAIDPDEGRGDEFEVVGRGGLPPLSERLRPEPADQPLLGAAVADGGDHPQLEDDQRAGGPGAGG